MTREEARLLLEVYRPGGPDAEDPRFVEALEHLKTDEELSRWFAQQQAFDAVVSRHVQSMPVPGPLKAAILAGEKVLAHLAWWRLVNWARVAALALVLATGAAFVVFSLNQTRGILAASREAIRLAESQRGSPTAATGDLKEFRGLLAKCRVPADFEVPQRLRRLPIAGCSLVAVQNRTAGVISFRVAGNTQLKLLVMDQVHDDMLPPDGSLRTIEYEDGGAALWSDKGKTYVLAGRFPPQSLRRLLI
jgi:hypothetical protein